MALDGKVLDPVFGRFGTYRNCGLHKAVSETELHHAQTIRNSPGQRNDRRRG